MKCEAKVWRCVWARVSSLGVAVAMVSVQTGCAPPTGGGGVANTNTNMNQAPAPANDNAAPNANDNAAPRVFVGAAVCAACHTAEHETWLTSRHENALESLRAIGRETDAACLPCHTVGFGEAAGFVDETATPHLAGVQCESCHGPSEGHTLDPNDPALVPATNVSGFVCGACHTAAHHPTFDEWQLSAHANSVSRVQSSPHAADACLSCHSEAYRFATRAGAAPPGVASVTTSIECVTCHGPHGSAPSDGTTAPPDHELRAPVAALCGACHAQPQDVFPDNTPHHVQPEMLLATGALDAAGEPLELALNHAHGRLVGGDGDDCARCHVVLHAVPDPNSGNPIATFHSFDTYDDVFDGTEAERAGGCLPCHLVGSPVNDPNVLVAATRAAFSDRLSTLAAVFDEFSDSFIDPATLSDVDAGRLRDARFNYDFVRLDGSLGVHNPDYATAALDAAQAIIDDLVTP